MSEDDTLRKCPQKWEKKGEECSLQQHIYWKMEKVQMLKDKGQKTKSQPNGMELLLVNKNESLS